MKKTLLFLTTFWLPTAVFFAQNVGQNLVQKLRLATGETAFLIENRFAEADPFTAFSLVFLSEKAVDLEFSTASKKNVFGPFETLPEDHHAHAADGFSDEKRHVHGLVFLPKGTRFLKIQAAKGHEFDFPKEVEAHFFAPQKSPKATIPAANPIENGPENPSHLCNCPQPPIVKRNVWCTTGACPYSATPTPTLVTHLIVHHSAGTGAATDWKAVVTAIWNYHVNTNGWADIGYNWLIAPDGTLFEGRQDNILGAHFCGTNGGTMGVCMLGTFTNATISAAAAQKLYDVLAWKACVRNVDPHDTLFHAASGLKLVIISGHRDGCATECPGDAFYPDLPAIRDSVLARLVACSPPVSTQYFLKNEAIRVFPNPASEGVFFIKMNENAVKSNLFELFDSKGQRIRTLFLESKTEHLVEMNTAFRGLFFWKMGEQSGSIFLE